MAGKRVHRDLAESCFLQVATVNNTQFKEQKSVEAKYDRAAVYVCKSRCSPGKQVKTCSQTLRVVVHAGCSVF